MKYINNTILNRINSAETWRWDVNPNRMGEELIRLRLEAGLSQEQLVEALKRMNTPVTRVTISYWENGIHVPSTQYLISLAVIYGIAVDDLLVTYEGDAA